MCRKVMLPGQDAALSIEQIYLLRELEIRSGLSAHDYYCRLPDGVYAEPGPVSRALNNLVRRGLVSKTGKRTKARYYLVR